MKEKIIVKDIILIIAAGRPWKNKLKIKFLLTM
nr:MAG TPA: hypothetical protein [Caudoviricetes sp.]